MITVNNNDGGTVVIAQPPYEARRQLRKQWKHTFRIFRRWYVTFSNCRVKKRYDTSNHTASPKVGKNIKGIKIKHYYKLQNGCCPHCGQHFTFREMEVHHVLPWSRFPELRAMEKNMLVLCHKCHKEIHCNPWLNIRLMKEKAAELGIDLRERYDYGKEECKQ